MQILYLKEGNLYPRFEAVANDPDGIALDPTLLSGATALLRIKGPGSSGAVTTYDATIDAATAIITYQWLVPLDAGQYKVEVDITLGSGRVITVPNVPFRQNDGVMIVVTPKLV